jgi:hypothetical protein
MLHVRAHESDEVTMARLCCEHLELLQAEYEFFDARDAYVKNIGLEVVGPSTVNKVKSESSDGDNWDEIFPRRPMMMSGSNVP